MPLSEEQKYALGHYATLAWTDNSPEDWAAILRVPVEDLAGQFKK